MLFAVTFLVGGFFVASTAQAATINVDNLQPDWNAVGGGGVYSAYNGPNNGYAPVSPGATARYDGSEAGIIKAGQGTNPGSGNWDDGIFSFNPNETINSFATMPLTYVVKNQYGENPVWMTIEIDLGGARAANPVYQFVPTPYYGSSGYSTVDARATDQWQLMDPITQGGTGSMMTLGSIAALPLNTGKNILRANLRLGMGDSYYSGSGTVAYVDKVTIGDTTYDFVVASADMVAPTATVAHDESAKTITYTFNEPVQLREANGTVLDSGSYASSLAVYDSVAYLDHIPGAAEPAHAVTISSAVLSSDAKSIVITYTGSLIKNADTSYVVDAWGKNITDLAGNKMAQDVSQIFTVNASAPTQTGPIDLKTASQFVVLAKTAVTTTGATKIVGDVGLSPAAASLITGFGLVLAGDHATSSLVTGNVYASNYAAPTPDDMTKAINDMVAAYTAAAAGQPNTTVGLGDGEIGGKIITPGVYKWSTDLTISTDVTLDCTNDSNGVFIFQIARDLVISSAKKVILTHGCQAENVFWQVGGPTGATLGTTSTFNGTILSATQVILQNGATLNGRAFAQTQVTLDANRINTGDTTTIVAPVSNPTVTIWSGNLNQSYSTYAPNTIFQANVNFDGGLTLSNFKGVEISLYNGTTLLATNTAKPALFSSYPNAVGATDLFGISDVANLLADPNWNIGAYPSNLTPTSVEFTLTRTDGTVYTVTGNIDAASIAVLATDAEAALVAAKVAAHTALITALGTYTQGNYTAGNWTTLNGFKTAGDLAIDAAGTTGTVTSAQTTATAGMAGVQTLAQEAAAATAAALATAKTDAHTALTTALAGYTVGNYSGANWTTLTGFKTTGDTAIDAATNLAGVSSAQNTATAGMAGVQTLAQEAATPPTNKDQCKDEGWKIFNNPSFKNQGDCVSFVEPSKGSSGSRPATPAIPVTPAVPAVLGASTGPIPGCGNRTTGFSVATGESCVGNSTGQVLGAEKFNFTKFLKFKAGSYKFSLQGAEVIELQKFLTSLGYDLGIADGKFGPKTEGAVIKFQIAKGLKGDGVVGALTREALNK